MARERKIRKCVTVKIHVSGWGDEDYFIRNLKEEIKHLHLDFTSVGVEGTCTIGIDKTEIISIEKE